MSEREVLSGGGEGWEMGEEGTLKLPASCRVELYPRDIYLPLTFHR
jgi:hypothetical protein